MEDNIEKQDILYNAEEEIYTEDDLKKEMDEYEKKKKLRRIFLGASMGLIIIFRLSEYLCRLLQ